ncbi:2',3'-cyclic-nucleotide 3'-phosphodiesterase-like [Babylonia areolata]|uniref:2',3'-cyclic-nucleotide 3'-phosphodiesterase-like n=1 Tax=Babylonia areolata TaxID=304850 RepID=UPI003FCF538E
MLLPAFVASASPVMVQDIRHHTNSIQITTYSNVDASDTSEVAVFCKIRYRRNKVHMAAMQKPSVQTSALDEVDADPSLLFPFLCDQETRNLIQRSRVLFLMRGLPGSGKSTIVKAICSAYHSSVVCSADDYFFQNGVYKFDAAGLGSAHEACQQKAKDACSAGEPVVIVDNTNVRRWEMKFYLSLASHMDYVVVPVQPKTAWRWNPEELAIRNKHGVDVETLKRKVNQFDDVIPVYYAWFIPQSSSKQLTCIAQCLLEECVQKFPRFSERLLTQLNISSPEQQQLQELFSDESAFTRLFKQYYTSGNKSGSMVHCTAKFCGGGRAVGAKAYHASPRVQSSVGQCFLLQIHSICFSPRTVGARVLLTDQQLPLFDKPEEKDWDGAQCYSPASSGAGASRAPAKRKSSSPPSDKRAKKKTARSTREENGEAAASVSWSSAPVTTEMRPTRTKPLAKKYGRSAHITIGCAQGVQNRETNFDVLRLCDMEAGAPATDADFVPVRGGEARYFGDGVCCVYFHPPLYVRTLYSGFY